MTILITGASRGIGRALLDGYTSAGADVLGTHRAADEGQMRQLDVTDPASQAALAERLGDAPLELLVCNAGIFPDRGQDLNAGYPAQMWADTFATNVTGVFLSIQHMLPKLRQAKDAKIAIISSQMGAQALANGGSYIYRASKAAALNLGRNLAADLKGDGIAVGIYHPGWVRTDMGGDSAAISTEESAQGLMDRFAELTLAKTGCFETWDGRAHAH